MATTVASTSRLSLRRSFPRALGQPARSYATPADDLTADPDAAKTTVDAEQLLVEQTESRPKAYLAWLKNEGERYRYPQNGRTNWIASTPFPRNPTFRPKEPTSSRTRANVFAEYKRALTGSVPQRGTGVPVQVADPLPENQVLRQLSNSYGLALDRIRAIVRLAAVEEEVKDRGEALQTEFSQGMESAMGASEYMNKNRLDAPLPEKSRSARKVWEFVNERKSELPVLPFLLNKSSSAPPSASSRQGRPRPLVGFGSYGPPPEDGYSVMTPEDGPPTANEASKLKIIDVSGSELGEALKKTWLNGGAKALKGKRSARRRSLVTQPVGEE